MDANGARALLARIELNHWGRAGAVQDGKQPSADPDADRLIEVGEGFRVYDDRREKRLVDEAWAPVALERRDAAA